MPFDALGLDALLGALVTESAGYSYAEAEIIIGAAITTMCPDIPLNFRPLTPTAPPPAGQQHESAGA
jgi:hypothetical protein